MTNAVTRAITFTQVGHGNQKRADVTLLSWLMFLYFRMSVLCIEFKFIDKFRTASLGLNRYKS